MDNILNTYNHQKLNKEEINHWNTSIICNKIEAAIESHKKENPVPDRFSSELYQTLTELISTLLKLFHKI
jgi:hypothetical protein